MNVKTYDAWVAQMKSCPFCGSNDVDPSFVRGYDDGDKTRPFIGAGCMDCGAAGPTVSMPASSNGYKKSVEKWNMRPNAGGKRGTGR